MLLSRQRDHAPLELAPFVSHPRCPPVCRSDCLPREPTQESRSSTYCVLPVLYHFFAHPADRCSPDCRRVCCGRRKSEYLLFVKGSWQTSWPGVSLLHRLCCAGWQLRHT